MTCKDGHSVFFSPSEEAHPKVTATGIGDVVPRDGTKVLRGCEDGQR